MLYFKHVLVRRVNVWFAILSAQQQVLHLSLGPDVGDVTRLLGHPYSVQSRFLQDKRAPREICSSRRDVMRPDLTPHCSLGHFLSLGDFIQITLISL